MSVFFLYCGPQGAQGISGTLGNNPFWGLSVVAEHEAPLKEE